LRTSPLRRPFAFNTDSSAAKAASLLKSQSIYDFEPIIPKIWKEELLDEEYDSPLSIAILEMCGPITLMIFNRCTDLAEKYFEMRDLRGLLLTAFACSSEHRKFKLLKLKS
tara:strand:- start:28 stop:360 length:333 start_codon:yes stop_codon:yes gene_type:complete